MKATGEETRIVALSLPVKSPWRNPIEAEWVHGKRAVSEAERLLSMERVNIEVDGLLQRSCHVRMRDDGSVRFLAIPQLEQ